MPEEITTPDGEQTPEPTPADTGSGSPDVMAELERTRKALKEANREAAERRKRIEAFEAAERERQEKDLSESQKLAKRLEEIQAETIAERQARESLEARLRSTQIENAALLKATELGFENPTDALRLLDLSAVEITEEGKVKGHGKLLEELAKSGRLPMKKSQSAIGTPRTQPNGTRPAPQPAPEAKAPIVRL